MMKWIAVGIVLGLVLCLPPVSVFAGGEAGAIGLGIAPVSVGFSMFGSGDVDYMYRPEVRCKYWLTDNLAIQPSLMGGVIRSHTKLNGLMDTWGDRHESMDSYFVGGSVAGLYHFGDGPLRPFVGISMGSLVSEMDTRDPRERKGIVVDRYLDTFTSYDRREWESGYRKLIRSTTHFLASLIFGAEYFFSESFSIGGEVSVEFDYGWEDIKEITRVTVSNETAFYFDLGSLFPGSSRVPIGSVGDEITTGEKKKDKRQFHQIISHSLITLNYYF